MQPFTASQAPENHRRLDSAEEQQRSRSGRETDIRKRKGCDVGEERQRGRPVARFPPCGLSRLRDEPERRGSRDDTDERKAYRVDPSLLQRQSTEKGVCCESDHRDQRQDEKSCRFQQDKVAS